MKMEIVSVINPQAAGPGRATCAIVAEQRTAQDVVPAQVAHVAMADGREVRFLYAPAEARALAEMLMVCACVAEGGPPPVIAPPKAEPTIILNGGRH